MLHAAVWPHRPHPMRYFNNNECMCVLHVYVHVHSWTCTRGLVHVYPGMYPVRVCMYVMYVWPYYAIGRSGTHAITGACMGILTIWPYGHSKHGISSMQYRYFNSCNHTRVHTAVPGTRSYRYVWSTGYQYCNRAHACYYRYGHIDNVAIANMASHPCSSYRCNHTRVACYRSTGTRYQVQPTTRIAKVSLPSMQYIALLVRHTM